MGYDPNGESSVREERQFIFEGRAADRCGILVGDRSSAGGVSKVVEIVVRRLRTALKSYNSA